MRDGLVSLARHDPFAALAPQQLARLTEIEERMRAGGTSPPDVRQFDAPDDADLIALMVAQGRLVSLANIALKQQVVFHAATIGQAQRSLAANFPPPTAFTTSAARTALGTTRKFIVPLLEHLDAQGISLVFKTMDASIRRVVGSIPIRLRQAVWTCLTIPHSMQRHTWEGAT